MVLSTVARTNPRLTTMANSNVPAVKSVCRSAFGTFNMKCPNCKAEMSFVGPIPVMDWYTCKLCGLFGSGIRLAAIRLETDK